MHITVRGRLLHRKRKSQRCYTELMCVRNRNIRESEMHLFLLLLGVLHAYTLCYVGVHRRFISHGLTHLSSYIILSMYNICNNKLQFARRWAIVDCRLKSDYGGRRQIPIICVLYTL